MSKLSLTDKLYCWFKGINPKEVYRVDDYYGNKVIWTKKEDKEFIKRTNDAYERCKNNGEYYSADEFLKELEEW